MEKDSLRSTNNGNSTNYSRDRSGGDVGLLRSSSDPAKQTTSSSDFVLQWGNRKRLRCMKIQVKDDHSSGPVNRTTVRVDRRVVRADKDSSNQPINNNNNNHGNGYFNLRQRPTSPQAPPPHRVLRNSDNSSAMRGQSNGGVRGFASPDRGAHDKRGVGNNHNNNNHHHHHNDNKSAVSSETAHDSKKGGSSSGSGEAAAPTVWPPKFVIALTNKEKEEDFMAIKGSKLPQRPKKRAKFIQRTLNVYGNDQRMIVIFLNEEEPANEAQPVVRPIIVWGSFLQFDVILVSPGAWLCDLTLERYEVREKKISKKRPRGLKAMGNMESDSE